MAFTKLNDFGLPLMSTKIAPSQPCLSPFERFESTTHYYSELSLQVSPCSEIFNLGSVDGRYTRLGLVISQYDLETENGVLEILHDYSSYQAWHPGSNKTKNETKMDVYVR